MGISVLLDIKPGVAAIIGGGGKTTLIHTLADELKLLGPVVICTTTGILPPRHIPVLCGADEAALESELRSTSVVCVGTETEDGKLRAPSCSINRLSELARYVLVEADGSRGLPMKAHAPGEPVIPDVAEQTILVVGAGGFGCTIREAAHRSSLYAKLAGVEEDAAITPELAAQVVLAENLHHRVFVNQAESEHASDMAKKFGSLLKCPVSIGSLHKNEYYSL